jgi:hypothetical protein
MWRAQGDDLRTSVSNLVAPWPQIKLPAGLSLQLDSKPEPVRGKSHIPSRLRWITYWRG